MTHIIAVGIPKEANDFKTGFQFVQWNVDGKIHQLYSQTAGYENHSILGRLSELTDEQCYPLVDAVDIAPLKRVALKQSKSDKKEIRFYNYQYQKGNEQSYPYPFLTAKESFISKLKSEGKVCKWMADQMPMFSSLPTQYQHLPDDFLILVKSITHERH